MPDYKIPFNLVASILFWFFGICLLIGILVVFARHGATRSLSVPVMFFTWGFAYCLAGFAMRRRRWGVRWWGAGLCILSVCVLALYFSSQGVILIVINLGALGLLLASWNEQPDPP